MLGFEWSVMLSTRLRRLLCTNTETIAANRRASSYFCGCAIVKCICAAEKRTTVWALESVESSTLAIPKSPSLRMLVVLRKTFWLQVQQVVHLVTSGSRLSKMSQLCAMCVYDKNKDDRVATEYMLNKHHLPLEISV